MREQLRKMIEQSVTNWKHKEDIYAISLFVYDWDDDPFWPTVTLGYNTEEQYQESIAETSDEDEARWNFAFWLQNEELVFGIEDTRTSVEQWIAESGFSEANGEDGRLTQAFVEELVELVRQMHESGFIQRQFGRFVPVIIHELEYYDEIYEQNVEANGGYIEPGFRRFCMGM